MLNKNINSEKEKTKRRVKDIKRQSREIFGQLKPSKVYKEKKISRQEQKVRDKKEL